MTSKNPSSADTDSIDKDHTYIINSSFVDCPILIAITNKIKQLRTFKDNSNKVRTSNVLVKFCDFTQNTYESELDVPTTLLVEYATHLSSTTSYSASTINSFTRTIKSSLTEAKSSAWIGTLSADRYRHYLKVITETIFIPEETLTIPRLAMSQLLPDMRLDDSELTDSLIHFCVAFLESMKKQRDYFLSNHFTAEKLKSFLLTNEIWESNAFKWDAKSIPSNFDPIFNAIICSENGVLIERLLCSRAAYRNSLYSASIPSLDERLYIDLKTGLYAYGGIRRYSTILTEEFYPTFDDIGFDFILKATDAEEICLSWLMASDRIQQSGLNNLLIGDIEVTPSNCTVMYTKKRAGEDVRDSTSHRANSWQYKIYSYYKNLRNEIASISPKGRENYFFSKSNLFNLPQHLTSLALRPIQIACIPNSRFHAEITEHSPKSNLFCEFFYAFLKRNSEITIARRSSGNTLQEPIPNEPFYKANDEQRLTLTPNTVAQSRAIIDSEPSTNSKSYTRYSESVVDAHNTAHNEFTKEVTYKGRSETLHRQNSRVLFTNAVSELQENDARKVLSLFENTKIVSLDDLKRELGWQTNLVGENHIQQFNALVSTAESHGYHCTPFGSLNSANDNKRIIVITPITAALLTSFIETCQEEIEKAENEERKLSIILQKTYVRLLLERFDKKSIAEGLELNAQNNFPKPWI
ncbi:hypothetical protein [Pseudomonas sp.]|uniref:hypothetical protein n=1 Tax=Pseudomonas sp. TaxID=306 RepID=UPI0024898187|nr:hypothetical protein [Pseudomonas sp.]MDI1330146.1 hypothetical protein [Pseudomonas sp.]